MDQTVPGSPSVQRIGSTGDNREADRRRVPLNETLPDLPFVNDCHKVHVFDEVILMSATRCRVGHLGLRRVKPLCGSFASLRPSG